MYIKYSLLLQHPLNQLSKMIRFQKLVLSLLFISSLSITAQEKWIAPESSNAIESPITNTSEAISNGQKMYKNLCVACHGVVGKGDGVAAAGLIPKPTDFTSHDFQKQTSGAMFWKLSKGRGVMASYETMLSEKERWEVISYLKSLKSPEKQPELEVKTTVNNTFFFNSLINTQTTEVLPTGASEFSIQHRFGATALNTSFIKDFFGTDLPSNIRLAYAKAINNKMYVELGRTKYGKVYDLGFKYKFLQQTLDNKMPISMAFYTNIGVNSEDFPTVPEGSTFENGSVFSYLFSHRLSYNTQLILSRKFSDKFSLQVAPVLIWENLVKSGEENSTLALPIGARYRITNKSALLLEITPKALAKDEQIPIALAWEIASSAAHAFQIIASSTNSILEQSIYSNPGYNYNEGEFVLGFNIKRIF